MWAWLSNHLKASAAERTLTLSELSAEHREGDQDVQ
jgi:hypothetical protein